MNRHVVIGLALGVGTALAFLAFNWPRFSSKVEDPSGFGWSTPEAEEKALVLEGPDYAVFEGGSVKMVEIDPMLPKDRKLSGEELFQLKLELTKERVKRRLLELEAKRHGLAPDDLLARKSAPWFWSKIPDEAIRKFLENRGVKYETASAETIRDAKKVAETLRVMDNGDRYLAELYDKANVRLLIEP